MPKLDEVVPTYIETVHVLVDDDPAGRRHAAELFHRLRTRDFEVIPRVLRGREAAL